MCVIINLEAGQSIPMGMLENACYNNWHSYGLISRMEDKLDVIKVLPESGEVNPKEVFDLLEKNKDYKRYLHLRHNTAGATNDENTHPFEVYYNKKTKRRVFFAHNGTMYNYVSKKYNERGIAEDDHDGPSDTLNYVNCFLKPFLQGTNYGEGAGDIKSNIVKKILRETWPTGNNRGLLVSSDQGEHLIGDWKTIKPDPQDEETWFSASNDTYFDYCIRGPEFKRRKEKEDEARRSSFRTTANTEVADLKDFDIFPQHGFYKLSNSISDILCDWDLYDRDGAVNLGMATRDEIEQLYDTSRADMVTVFEWITCDYYNLYEEFNEIKKKHENGTKKIASLVEELKKLKGEDGKKAKKAS